MLAVLEWESLIAEPIRQMLTRIMAYLPILLGALLILIVGWLIAKAIRRLIDWLLTTVRFDTLADKAGISAVLRKGDLKISASQVVSGLVYWLIMIMVLIMTVDALGLPKASDVLASLFAYVPKVIAALLVLIVALFLASFVSGIVEMAAANANLPKPELLASISRWAIIIFAVTISLVELGIAPLLVTATFNIILGGIVLALALAFGLGGKDAAARYLDELKKNRDMKKGGRKVKRRLIMLYTLVVVLLILWLAGLLTSYTMGGLIHLLLVIAIVVILLRVISGRKIT